MKQPSTYSEWVECLDAFNNCNNDEHLIELMENGKLEWTSGVAERFTKRFGETLDFRLNIIRDGLENEFKKTFDENMLTRALVNARNRMKILLRLTDMNVLPDNLRSAYTKLVKDSAAQIQNSLEQSAKSDRTGAVSRIVKSTKLTNISIEQNSNLNQSINTNRPRRRVIL